MMKTLLFLLFPLFLSAQDFNIKKHVDDFTGQSGYISDYFYIGDIGKDVLNFAIGMTEGQYAIIAGIYGESLYVVGEGQPLMIKLHDDTVLTGYSESIKASEFTDSYEFKIAIPYIFSKADFERLATSPIYKVRVKTTDSHQDFICPIPVNEKARSYFRSFLTRLTWDE
jgi:hypothetical protein